MTDELPGVTVSVWIGVFRLLQREHGRKMAGAQVGDITELLKQVEALYLQLPDEPPKKRKRTKTKPEPTP